MTFHMRTILMPEAIDDWKKKRKSQNELVTTDPKQLKRF